MGVTIIQKSNLSKAKKSPMLALVLAGGAITGGAYKIGGLLALDAFLENRKVTEFDMYVGLSAGGFLGSFLAGGIDPNEMLLAMDGKSDKVDPFQPWDFYWPAYKEFWRRASRLGKDLIHVWPAIAKAMIQYLPLHEGEIRRNLRKFMEKPSYQGFEQVLTPLIKEVMDATPIPHPGRYIPSGIFDNSRIEKYIQRNFKRNNIPNNFRMLKKQRGVDLYITATNLNTAQMAVFGHDFDSTLSISEAVQASTAIPGFYIPPKLRGEEYLDGGLRKTANISLAMLKGADLIIVYNPFRPFMNRSRYQLGPNAANISDWGMGMVLNQSFRALLQSRLHQGLERLRLDPHFKGDLILIEPTETDVKFFNMNPIAFWSRGDAARHGFVSVKRSLDQNYRDIQEILGSYGIRCRIENISLQENPYFSDVPKPEPDARPMLRVVK